MKNCPICAHESTDAAVLCLCGYDFFTHTAARIRRPLADRASRLGAQIIDGLVSAGAMWLALRFVRYSAAFSYLGGVLSAGYFLLSDGLPGGQSLGKILFGIAVVDDATDRPCTFASSFLRNVTAILGIFDWLFIFGERRKRTGDWLAHTRVVSVGR